jgi:protein-disulfide isomerase
LQQHEFSSSFNPGLIMMNMSVWGQELRLPVSPQRDHIRGPVDAPITLLEYGDYECPYCGAAHPVVNAVREEMGHRLRFVFRHFPLVTIHPHAELASEAAEAAGAQGKFWKMHDAIFSNQENLTLLALAALGEAIGLDLDRFREDLETHVHAGKVREDFMSGVRSGVNGTPTFFINGLRYNGSAELPDLLAAIKAAGQERSAA